MSTENIIEYRNPNDLRPIIQVQEMHRWNREDPRWIAFVADIKNNGIVTPLVIAPDGTLYDGETRRQAALLLRLDSVPCRIVAGCGAFHALRELTLRRHLTRQQEIWVLYESKIMDLAEIEDAIGNHETMEAIRRTYNREYLRQAAEVRDLFERWKDTFEWTSADAVAALEAMGHSKGDKLSLRDYFRPQILDAESPMSLGSVLKGIKYKLAEAGRIKEPGEPGAGGRPCEAGKQLELFIRVFKTDLTTRFAYWGEFDKAQKKEAIAAFATSITGAPEDFLAGQKKAIAKELKRRKAEKSAK